MIFSDFQSAEPSSMGIGRESTSEEVRSKTKVDRCYFCIDRVLQFTSGFKHFSKFMNIVFQIE